MKDLRRLAEKDCRYSAEVTSIPPSTIISLLDRLKDAEDALKFYADKLSWHDDGSNFIDIINSEDTQEFRPERKSVYIGGRRARSYFKKYEGKSNDQDT
jgi:hypothetical protein